MTPDEINAKHGGPSWRCWKCKAESRLYWWNDLSVAVCIDKPECGKAFCDFLSAEIAAQEAYEAHCKENAPW